MSYEKKTWKTDDLITSEALNNIEEQVAANEAADAAASAAIAAADAKAEKGNPLTVRFSATYAAGGGYNVTTDAVFADVAAAAASGREVDAEIAMPTGMTLLAPLQIKMPAGTPTTLIFNCSLDYSDGNTTATRIYSLAFTASDAAMNESIVRGGPLIVPFTVTFDEQTGEPAASTSASFSSTLSALAGGAAGLAQITVEIGGLTSVLYGVLSANESETPEDRSIYTSVMTPDVHAPAEPGGEATIGASAALLQWSPTGIMIAFKDVSLS